MAIILGICSCGKQSYKYDWTALDAFMDEHGEEYPEITTSRYDYGNTIVVEHSRTDEKRQIIQIVKTNSYLYDRYYIQFEIEYYTIIPDTTVKLEFVWFLPYDTSEKYYDNRIIGSISCYKTNSESVEEYLLTLKQISVFVNFFQINTDGQFVDCEYLYQNVYSVNLHSELDVPELDNSLDYYYDNMLATMFNVTTNFLNANNIPLFYEFANELPKMVVSSTNV